MAPRRYGMYKQRTKGRPNTVQSRGYPPVWQGRVRCGRDGVVYYMDRQIGTVIRDEQTGFWWHAGYTCFRTKNEAIQHCLITQGL